MKHMKLSFFLLLLLIVAAGCNGNSGAKDGSDARHSEQKDELFVSAAASLTDALNEIAEIYEKEEMVDITFNFAGSGKLARQIQQGAPVDVFISANANWMADLKEEGLIDADSVIEAAGNKLVLIANKDSPIRYESFAQIDGSDIDRIAIGNPGSVPAGEYAEAVLKKHESWDDLESKFVYAQDVRQVLTYVETGNADVGFVYESDALTSDAVNIVAESDSDLHDSIVYPAAVVADSTMREEARGFLQFLTSEAGQEILHKYGFSDAR